MSDVHEGVRRKTSHAAIVVIVLAICTVKKLLLRHVDVGLSGINVEVDEVVALQSSSGGEGPA